jgi:hypothetical protein
VVAVLVVVEQLQISLAALELLVKDLLAVMLCGTAVPLQMVVLEVAVRLVLVVILLEQQGRQVLVVLV